MGRSRGHRAGFPPWPQSPLSPGLRRGSGDSPTTAEGTSQKAGAAQHRRPAPLQNAGRSCLIKTRMGVGEAVNPVHRSQLQMWGIPLKAGLNCTSVCGHKMAARRKAYRCPVALCLHPPPPPAQAPALGTWPCGGGGEKA